MIPDWLKQRLGRGSARHIKFILNTYPPYVGAGIRVTYAAKDYLRWDVELRLNRFNRNYFSTHFGGSIYAMCDPFYVLMIAPNLGDDFIVWDQAAEIKFKKPGTGTLYARFEMQPEEIDAIREKAKTHRRQEPTYGINVTNEAGEVVAEISKKLYIRRAIKGSRDPRAVNKSRL